MDELTFQKQFCDYIFKHTYDNADLINDFLEIYQSTYIPDEYSKYLLLCNECDKIHIENYGRINTCSTCNKYVCDVCHFYCEVCEQITCKKHLIQNCKYEHTCCETCLSKYRVHLLCTDCRDIVLCVCRYIQRHVDLDTYTPCVKCKRLKHKRTGEPIDN